MSRYRMSDGMIVDTDKASKSWTEASYHDGRNRISVCTGSQWDHQKLYRSKRGRYYLECWSDWQGSQPSAEWISNEEATRWLLMCYYDLPDDLAAMAEQITE